MSNVVDVLVLGAGAAGLLAAARCAERGRKTALLEKNRKAGVKILISGGTRCNLTQNTDAKGVIHAFGPNGRFLHSALTALGPADVIQLFEREGVPTKVESTGKVFPVSDRALDVQQALLRRVARSGCDVRLESPVLEFFATAEGFRVRTPSTDWTARKVIVATGGCSYPGCGTTGDGYAWMRSLGHTIVPPRPALVPITSGAQWVRDLSGVTLPDVLVRVVPTSELDMAGLDPQARAAVCRKKKLDERRASLLFTHFGLSGPAVLDVSRSVTALASEPAAALVVDLLPDEPVERIEDELRKQCESRGGRTVGRIIPECIPQRLAHALLGVCGLSQDQRAAELNKSSRRWLAAVMKSLAVPVSGTRGFAKAEVTAGGVSLSEVDSRTMESKIVPGLHIAGEILDLDGRIGGYNFQSAFSTGWLAAESI